MNLYDCSECMVPNLHCEDTSICILTPKSVERFHTAKHSLVKPVRIMVLGLKRMHTIHREN